MNQESLNNLFSEENIKKLFPENLADRFFEALYGDPSEGAYEIGLVFKGQNGNYLNFEFQLNQRPGKCLRCNLTYGLPQVFERHPLINVKGLVEKINDQLDGAGKCIDWKLGDTVEISRQLHVIPLVITIEDFV